MKKNYFGYEFRPAVESFAHKVCESLGLEPVDVEWSPYTQTACINRYTMRLAMVRDEAVLSLGDLRKYTGYVVHELLHRKYTDFKVNHAEQYVNVLHNAIEDAWIEHKAIQSNLTGNIADLLGGLIDSMTAEALTKVSDWSNPAQYPFALAVYARPHASIKVPLAHGLTPIFDEALARTHKCRNSRDTLAVAVWVYGQLSNLPTEQPEQPPVNPAPSDDAEQGDESTQGGEQGNEQGDSDDGAQDGAQDGEKGSTSPDQGEDKGKVATAPKKGSEAMEVEPQNKAPENANSQGAYSQMQSLQKNGYHVSDRKRFTVGA